ncbi:MAG: helix-turn-helix domain-containing protein [Pseudonocardiales bacterium]
MGADDEVLAIGERLRRIRSRRGLGLTVAAGLAGISKPYLSMLERGERGFNRRGLLEDLAGALGCSVADLTGQPYHLPDRQSVDVGAAVAEISTVLHDTTLADVPDVPARCRNWFAPLRKPTPMPTMPATRWQAKTWGRC